jgi:hypothetical protein
MLAEVCALTDCIDLVKAEYLEMPGLHLTKPQIQRMWSLDDHTCDLLLDALVTDGFLTRTDRNAYALARHDA